LTQENRSHKKKNSSAVGDRKTGKRKIKRKGKSTKRLGGKRSSEKQWVRGRNQRAYILFEWNDQGREKTAPRKREFRGRAPRFQDKRGKKEQKGVGEKKNSIVWG